MKINRLSKVSLVTLLVSVILSMFCISYNMPGTLAVSSNRMLNFNADDYIDIGDVNTLDGIQQFTIEMWIHVSGTVQWGALFDKSISLTNRILLQFSDNSGNLGFVVANGNNSYWQTTNNPITLGDWFHLAAIFDGTQATNANRYTLYINGIKASLSVRPGYTENITTHTPSNNASFHAVTGGIASGNMDEFRVWTDVRTQQEVIDNMNHELTGSEADLLMYYDFNQGVPGGNNAVETTALDRTGHGYNGALNNFALTGNSSNWVSRTYMAPTVQASNITFSGVSTNQFTANWTRGSGNQCAAFVKTSGSGTSSPADNTTYTANAAFGSGSQIGTTGWYCVYKGTGNSVIITGLSASTSYQVHICEYNGAAGSELYKTTTATNNSLSQTTVALTNVGGVAYPPNKPVILALWMALAAAVIAGAIIAVRWQKARS